MKESDYSFQTLVFLLNPKRQGLSCYFCCIAYYRLASSETSGQFSSLYLPQHNRNAKIKDVCYHTWLFYLSFRNQNQVARQFYMLSHFPSSCFSRNISCAKKQNTCEQIELNNGEKVMTLYVQGYMLSRLGFYFCDKEHDQQLLREQGLLSSYSLQFIMKEVRKGTQGKNLEAITKEKLKKDAARLLTLHGLFNLLS